jgi:hypothetical protein
MQRGTAYRFRPRVSLHVVCRSSCGLRAVGSVGATGARSGASSSKHRRAGRPDMVNDCVAERKTCWGSTGPMHWDMEHMVAGDHPAFLGLPARLRSNTRIRRARKGRAVRSYTLLRSPLRHCGSCVYGYTYKQAGAGCSGKSNNPPSVLWKWTGGRAPACRRADSAADRPQGPADMHVLRRLRTPLRRFPASYARWRYPPFPRRWCEPPRPIRCVQTARPSVSISPLPFCRVSPPGCLRSRSDPYVWLPAGRSALAVHVAGETARIRRILRDDVFDRR